jgi:hypothetical protein
MRFDGSAAYMLDGWANNARLTWAAWVRPFAIGVKGAICGHQDTAQQNEKTLYLSSTGQFYLYIYDGANKYATSTTVAQVGRWYHVVGTGDGTNIRIYVNGVLEATTAAGAAWTSYSSNNIRIGGGIREGGNPPEAYFAGDIARASLWTEAISAGQVKELAQGSVLPGSIMPQYLIGDWILEGNPTSVPNRAVPTGIVNSSVMTKQAGTTWASSEIPPQLEGSTDLMVPVEEPEEIEKIDAASIYLKLTPSSVDIAAISEQATIYLDVQVSGAEVYTRLDAATIYLDLRVLGGECYSTFAAQLLGEGEADLRWISTSDQERWVDEEELRWDEGDVSLGEGIHC